MLLIQGLVACNPQPAHTPSPKQDSHKVATQSPPVSTSTKSPTVTVKAVLNSNIQTLQLSSSCSSARCPTVTVARLSSNEPQLDQLVDDFILRYCDGMVSGFDTTLLDVTSSSQQITPTNKSNPTAQSEKRDQLELALQPFLFKLNKIAEQNQAYGNNAPLSLNITPEVVAHAAVEKPMATLLINAHYFLGGAHGSADKHYINYDLNRHTQINLDDMILAGKRKSFNQMVYQKFIEWLKENMPESDVDDYQKMWNFKISENFYLSPDGLILQYGEYEIAPYVFGLPRLVIPYAQLQGIIKPDYLPMTTTHAPH